MIEEKKHGNLLELIAIFFVCIMIYFSIQRAGGDPLKKQYAGERLSNPSLSQEELEMAELKLRLAGIPEPEIRAEAYLVKFIGGWSILERRKWKQLPPASLTKILTAVVAKEILPEDMRFSFGQEAKNIEEKKSSASAGEIFSLDDFLRFTIIGSYNDAALALAEAVGKFKGGGSFLDSLEIFKKLMMQKAVEIGMKDSYFANPAGLDDKNMKATAADLARLSEYVWNNHPDLWQISRTIETNVESNLLRSHFIKNTNDLLREFPAVLGGKTGFTDEAKGTLILLYQTKINRTAVIVILGSEDRFGDGRKILKWLDENL